MSFIVPILLLFFSGMACATESLPVLLPLQGTVMDEYKQEVRAVQVQPNTVVASDFSGSSQSIDAVYNTSAQTYQPSSVTVKASSRSTAVAARSSFSQQGHSGSVVAVAPTATMKSLNSTPAHTVSAVSVQKKMIHRVAATTEEEEDEEEDEDEEGRASVRKRLGGIGGMGSDTGDDPNRSKLSPIGDGWVLLLFAFAYGGWRLRRRKKMTI